MRALRLNGWKSTPVVEDVPQPIPGPGEVVIKIGAAGARHSDLHLMHEFEAGAVPWNPPFTLAVGALCIAIALRNSRRTTTNGVA